MESGMFEAIDIWKRVSTTELVRYRCFKSLLSQRYSVQSADFYRTPSDLKQEAYLERNYFELLAEQAPDERGGSYPSLLEAIEAHELEFGSPKEEV